MNQKPNLSFIDLENLTQLSRGDDKVVYKYLHQFRELVPKRIAILRESLQAEDRKMIRQILHKMNPQLQFFGIREVVGPIQQLESGYLDMPMPDLKSQVKNILLILEKALDEVEMVLASDFE